MTIEQATAEIISNVYQIESWVDDHPEHEVVREWSRTLLVATLALENELNNVQEENRHHWEKYLEQIDVPIQTDFEDEDT